MNTAEIWGEFHREQRVILGFHGEVGGQHWGCLRPWNYGCCIVASYVAMTVPHHLGMTKSTRMKAGFMRHWYRGLRNISKSAVTVRTHFQIETGFLCGC